MDLIIPFIVIALLILLNGMFVAAEFAIIGVRPTRIEQLAGEGHSAAKRLSGILKDPAKVDRYIASAQLGITLASLGLGMYGEPVIAHLIEAPLHDWFGLEGDIIHTIGFFFALSVITYLHIVIGEMVPKSLSLQNAERTVLMLATPMLLMQTIFSYPITMLNRIGVLVLRLLRIPPPASGSRLHTPGELELIISESVVGGMIAAEEEALIGGVFDFMELTAGQMMVPRPKINALPVTISEVELLEKIVLSPHTRFPIYEGTIDNILGVVHLKDVVEQQVGQKPFDITALMHEVPFVPETMSAEKLLITFRQARLHMVIVVDEYGGTAGIVTLEDLIEEIVGEVRDEFDTHEQEPVVEVEKGNLIVRGTVRLDELTEYVDLEDDSEEVDTVGGLMISHLKLPPSKGDELTLKGVTLKVEEVSGLAIERVSIRFSPKPDAPNESDAH